jgi:hypothetical protein
MKQKFNTYCDKYMWFILPLCSSIAIMLGVVIEKHYPMSELIQQLF